MYGDESCTDFVRGELGHLDTPLGVGTGEVRVWVEPRPANKSGCIPGVQ